MRAHDRARLHLGVVEQGGHAAPQPVGAEARDHLVHLALAGVDRRDLGREVAHVLFGHAHVEPQDVEQLLVEPPGLHQLRGRDADAFLVDFGQRAREAGRNGAAHVGVVDVAGDEADDFAVVEHRLPDVDVGRVGGDEAAVQVVGNADVARRCSPRCCGSRGRNRGRRTRWRRASSGEAKVSPSGVSSPQEKSSVSLTKVECAVRISVDAIASAAAAQ